MRSMELRKGMRVMVYDDPVTRQVPEGWATLHHDETGSHGALLEGYATWSVTFDGEAERYVRTFRVEDVEEGGAS